MCILCEEPFRSLIVGLAAIGLISLGRYIVRGWSMYRARTEARFSGARLSPTAGDQP